MCIFQGKDCSQRDLSSPDRQKTTEHGREKEADVTRRKENGGLSVGRSRQSQILPEVRTEKA